MYDGEYNVSIKDGVASVYDCFGVELVGASFKEFVELVSSSKGQKKAVDYQRNLSKVVALCQWKPSPKIKDIRNKTPSVYMIGVPSLNIVKIGRSEKARQRMRHHARYVEGGMVILGIWECPDDQHMAWLESALHHHLVDYRVEYDNQRVWFDLRQSVNYLRENVFVDIRGTN